MQKLQTSALALKYINDHKKELKLSDQDAKDLVFDQDLFDDFSNTNRVWFQQTYNGLELNNGYVAIHIKDGKVVYTTNSGVYDLKNQVSQSAPVVRAEDAIANAARLLNYSNALSLKQIGKDKKDIKSYSFEKIAELSKSEINAKLLYVKDKQDKVKLAWFVSFASADDKSIWNITVNAIDGSVIYKRDLVLHCEFGIGSYVASQSGQSSTQMIERVPGNIVGNGTNEQNLAGSYRVYPYGVESPVFGSRQLLSDPSEATASPYGWHDTNGVAGAESNYTRGNNVNAYTDKDGNDQVNPSGGVDGNLADGGAGLNFDFALDFTTRLDTLINSKAVVTQLFYMNNIMHDIFYKYGFTDANRNFQLKNYASGNTATDNDPVNAEAHDGSKDENGVVQKNNANFYTSADGENSLSYKSRMQMFMWDGTPPSTLTFNAPADIAGDIQHGSQNGWGPCSYNITGAVANATSATAPASYVCGAVNNASSISGKIALIDRGTCNFSEKVYNVQQAGAIGAIIINRQSAGDSLIGMASGTSGNLVTIPAMFVTYAVGQQLRNNIATANVTMTRVSTNNCIEYDGALDNGIVSHEYGHGISTRLTGTGAKPNGFGNCLGNEEEGGEGWSDFFALALSKKPTDNKKNTARGIGSYVLGETSTGPGIRRNPYSYDMTINPVTYDDLAASTEVHDIGEIWCSAIWDMYWILTEKYGYSNDLYNGTLGNNRAIKLVIEGLKLQVCNPGFLDSRNAILKADSILYGNADKCEIWTAFARRGMGASANQGSNLSATDQTAAFDIPAACNTTPTATASFTASDTTVCAGGSLTFTNTSTASSGSPDSVRWTIAGGVPGTSTSTTTVVPTFSTPGTYIISLVAYKSGNASSAATKSIRVKALPIVQVNSPAICSGATASLTATGATTYAWSPNIGSIAAVTTPALTTTTTYTVTGTTQGCTGTAVSTVTVNATPNVSVNSPSICAGTTADLVASGATSYAWSPNIGSGASVTTPSLTTTTTYTVTGTTGTCSKTAVATVTVTALPNVSVNSPTICTGTAASLTATGATSYTWSPNIGSGATVTTPTLTTTTTYTVTGTTGSCSKTAVATVTVTAPPPVAVNSPSICSGLTASLTATGATSYTWSPNIGSGSSVTTPTLTTTTTYTVTGTTGNCSATAVATVTVNATPNVTVNSPTICAGTTADLTAGGATSYSWSPNIGSGASVTTPNLTTTTTYTVTGTTGTCSKTAVATVTVTPLPNVTVTSPSVCSGSSATLQANGATTYTWTGGLASGATTTTPVLTATTTYTVTGTTGTCSKTAVATVTVNASAPTVTISSVPNPASVCFGDAITLTGNGANNYTWTSSQTGTTGGGTLNFTPNGNITVSLSGTVTGCSTPGTTSINITVKSKPTVAAGNVGICANNTADLEASGADTYSWSPNIGSGSTVTTPILTTTTTYTVTGTTNGCTNTAVATVTVTARPNVSVGSISVCSGFTANLSASGADTYTWSPNIGSGSNVTTPSLTTTTTYTVTGTANSCTGTAVSTVTVNPTPATPGITQSSDTLYSSAIIVGASYQWYKGGVLQGTTSVR
ncbi:MAG: M36 family metallopeptidase [Sphingobacteriales bacterium]|nr:M36 family metallopeptidase [Sphingobacteriales bacterium]